MMNFCMKFWTDGREDDTRLRNVLFTWPYLKNMVEYLNSIGIESSAQLFDYSPEKLIDDAVHIPYPLSAYRRSEKINNILANLVDEDYVSIVDSDVFIHRTQWDALGALIKNMTYNDGYFFNLGKLFDFNPNVIEAIKLDTHPLPNVHYAYIQDQVGGFGAFFLSSVGSIKECGGFDEKYTTWGGEDGEMMDRWNRKFIRNCVRYEQILPLHLPHFEDRENILYFNYEEYVRNNCM